MADTDKLLTAEDLVHVSELEQHYELIDGKLVAHPFHGGWHGLVVADLCSVFGNYSDTSGQGTFLAGHVGIILRRNPDTVRAPDFCGIAGHTLSSRELGDSYLERVPDLIIEVVDFHDNAWEVQERVEDWLKSGARMLWLVYPPTRKVLVFRGLGDVRWYSLGESIDLSPLFPDFAASVNDVFRQLERR